MDSTMGTVTASLQATVDAEKASGIHSLGKSTEVTGKLGTCLHNLLFHEESWLRHSAEA
jgi:hypothetical protein